MKRPNLKELRDVLNQIPEKTLEVSSIATDCAITENPDGDFKVMWIGDESEWDKYGDDFRKDEKNILDNFTDYLNKDLAQAKIPEDHEDYDEEYNEGGDW